MGASAGVMAIIFAATFIAPNYSLHLFIFGRVPLKYITLVLILLDLVNIASFQNVGGHLAHFGGAIAGLLFAKFIPANAFKGIWSRSNQNDAMTFKKVSMKMSHNRAINDDEYNTVRTSKQEKLDSILDKISEKGYDKLTKDEKEFLSNFKE
jgi:high-affinity K+ transport system ATPase subunit B